MIVRPYGVVLGGVLELGVELVLAGGKVLEIRPHTGLPEPYVVSPAFVNAHSHFEYLGLEGQVEGESYWPWIRELTRMKAGQSEEDVRADSMRAAELNRATGVAFVAEHSDRPFSGPAMAAQQLDGVIFQEVITLREHADPMAKLADVAQRAEQSSRASGRAAFPSPHAYFTVSELALRALGAAGNPMSIHIAETEHESNFTRGAAGPIAEFYQAMDLPCVPTGKSVVGSLADLGCVRPGVQFVHCCALEEGDLAAMSDAGVTVAHCPRSNERLQCPKAPVREMLDAGVEVGLGLDSAASSGRIDLFAEMREALAVSRSRGRPVSAEEVWLMATEMGRRSVPTPGDPWRIEVGSTVPLIAIHVPDAAEIEGVIEAGSPEKVRWL